MYRGRTLQANGEVLMKLINDSRFTVNYVVRLSSPDSTTGSILGGAETDLPQPTFTVDGDAGQLGKAGAENVPSNATATFTIENGKLRITVESTG